MGRETQSDEKKGWVVLGSDSDSLGGKGGRRMDVPEDGEDRVESILKHWKAWKQTISGLKKGLDKIVLASQY